MGEIARLQFCTVCPLTASVLFKGGRVLDYKSMVRINIGSEAIGLGLFGGACYILHRVTVPDFRMQMKKTDNTKVVVCEKTTRRPEWYNIWSRRTLALPCLNEKGYKITSYKGILLEDQENGWRLKHTIRKEDNGMLVDIDIEELLADCKECGVATEIEYTHEQTLMHRFYKEHKRMDWHKCDVV